MDENAVKATPKEALKNLVDSMKTPLIWMGVGAALTIVVQMKTRKRIAQ